jgi:hypothetical protein
MEGGVEWKKGGRIFEVLMTENFLKLVMDHKTYGGSAQNHKQDRYQGIHTKANWETRDQEKI